MRLVGFIMRIYMSVFIGSGSTTFRALVYIQFLYTTYFICFWSSSDRFYNDMRGKEYRRIWMFINKHNG